MIVCKKSYEIRLNGFDSNPLVVDDALQDVFKSFNNDPEEIALFLNSALKNRKLFKLQEAIRETANSMDLESLKNLAPDTIPADDDDLPF